MDFSPDSPARPLAGAARSRVLARQQRNSAQKPYNRSELPKSGSSGSLHAAEDGFAVPSTPTAKASSSSAFTPLRVAASPFALLGSVTKMVSKPLSWLTRSVVASQPELGIPTSSSTGSLSSMARKRAAAQAGKTPNDVEDNPSALAARAVGERLAAGLRARPAPPRDDEESQLRPPPSNSIANTASTSRANAARPPLASTNTRPTNASLPGSSSLTRSFTFSEKLDTGKPLTWSTRASKRTLDIGSPGPNASFDTFSDSGRAASPSANLRSPRSQLSLHRSSSLRPEDAMSESGSVLSHSNSSYAFGYGSEVRYANNSFGLPPSTSPFQLASRGGVRRARSSLGPALFSDPATPRKSPHASQLGLRGASPAASVVSRPREGTPQRRNWNGLNLTAPSAPSIGDDMMKEYLSARTLPRATAATAKGHGPNDMLISSPVRSAATGSVMDESDIYTPGRLGKRDIEMSVDGDSERLATVGTPSKRRMVWHPEMGFISHEELKAREPKLPSPKNEAERLLNVLENMRATKAKSAPGPSRGPPTNIHVPTPTPEPAAAKANTRGSGRTPVHVAPYSRAVKKAKEAQTAPDAQNGMRSRLKKVQPAEFSTSAMDEDEDHLEEASVQETVDDPEESVAQEEEPEPKPEPVRRSRRLQHRDPDAKPEVSTPAKTAGRQKQDSQLKSALKSTPLKAAPSAAPAVTAPIETPKPSSHRISLAAANKAPSSSIKKDNFTIKASTADPSGPRERSSLRQGAAKTSRTHQSSGKFSAWDEDEEDEDLPDATELAKIKIPANMFPTGFTFGSAEASNSEAPKEPKPQPSGGSLLGRLGGFDSSNDSAKEETAEKPSFSFSAPAKDAPSAPKFTFGAPAASITTEKKEAEKPKAQLPPASDFFSKPAESVSSSITEAKKDGPVPNFFGSTVQKFESKSADEKSATASTGTGFSFGNTSGQQKNVPASGSMFGGNTFGGSSEAKKDTPAVSKPSFFGNAASAAPTSGGFSFGAPAASSNSKRSAADDDEPAAKKAAPSFSFGGSLSSSEAPKANAPSSTGGFSFGAPKASEESTPKDSGVPNFFGAKGDTPSAGNGGFSFGKPAEKPSTTPTGGFIFSMPDSAPSAASSSGGFSFSKPAAGASQTPSSGFSFGAPASSAASAEPKPASTTPSFSFGSSKTESADGAPASSAPSTTATTPTNTFTFGAPSSSSATTTSQPANGGFSFGSSTTPGSSGGFGGFGSGSGKSSLPDKPSGNGEMMDDAPQPSGSAPKFSFGASSTSTAPSTSGSPAPFTFGASPSSGPAPSSSAPAPSGFGSAPTSFSFGSSAPASGSLTPSGPPPTGGFRFGSPAPTSAPASNSAPSFTFGGGATTPGQVNSTPASPFLAPQQAPPTPGGSPFQFGAPQPSTGTSSSTPFQFGAGAPAAPSSSGFSFGAPAASNPAPTFGGFGGGTPPPSAGPTSTGFSFGAGLPSMPSMPSMPGTPGAAAPGGGMFSMGAAPAPNANNSPGARQIKPLRSRRR